MSDGTGVIFMVHTGEAVAALQRLKSELDTLHAALGKKTQTSFSQLDQGLTKSEKTARKTTQALDQLSTSTEKNAKTMASYSQKIHQTSTRVSFDVTASQSTVRQQLEKTNAALKDPTSWLYHQKQLENDIRATKLWAKERQEKITALTAREHRDRKKELRLFKEDIEKRSKIQIAGHAFEMEQERKRFASLSANSEKGRKDTLASMQRTIRERFRLRDQEYNRLHALALVHNKKIEKANQAHLTELQRQERLAMAFRESSLKSQISKINKVRALQASGKFSDAAIIGRHGAEAVSASSIQNLNNLQSQLAVQKEMEKVERSAERTRNKGTNSIIKNTAAIRANAAAMHNARGAARGLSGSLGQLWMTYGAIAPLAAGAALGAITRQTYAVGKDVEYRLKMIEALGNRAIQISEMMPAVHGSMMTPLQAAEGLQELAQAGLNADESLSVLAPTLQLATLGGMSVSEAAITATAALSTFHLEVSEASRVGDVFAKTASVSNTTVKGIAEAMRQAGSAASIYGVTLEETAAQIAIMAQNGIRGSAAGTAVRNAMTELHAPTAKARDLMEKFGIEMYKEGNVTRNYMDVLEDLRSVYYSMDEAGQNALLKGMFNERSRRAIQIYMQDLDNLKALYGEITDSQLFLLDANLKLLSTVEGASNRMSSVFQQSLVKSFENLQPLIISTIQSLEEMFGSSTFQRTVETLGGAVARLTRGFTDHMGVLITIGTVYAGHRVALGVLSASYGLLQAAKERNNIASARTIAMTELETAAAARNAKTNTVAGAAAATRTSRLITVGTAITRVATVVGWVSLAVSAGVSLWNAWRSSTDENTNAQKKLEPTLDNVLKVLKSQNEELERNIKLQKEQGKGQPEGTSNFEIARVNTERDLYAARARQAAIEMEIQALEERARIAAAGKKGGPDTLSDDLARMHKLRIESGELAKVITESNDKIIASEEELDKVKRQSREQEAGRIRNSLDSAIKEAEMRVKHGKNISDAYAEGVAAIVRMDEEFRASGEENLEAVQVFEIKIREALESVQRYLNSFDGSALGPWIESQRKASEGSLNLSNAIRQGSEAVTKYNIEQEAQRQTLEFTQKSNENYESILRRVTNALWDAHHAESRLNAVRQISNIKDRTQDLKGQLTVLQAHAKGVEAVAKAENELAYNKSLKEVLEGVAIGDQPAVAQEHLNVWSALQTAQSEVLYQQKVNEARKEGLSLGEKHLEQVRELEKLRDNAKTDEDREVITKRLIKLEDDYQKSLNKGGGGRAARQIERLDVWISKQYAAADAAKDLAEAYKEGEASLLEYEIQKEASVKAQEYANRGSAEYKRIQDEIAKAVRKVKTEEAKLELAKMSNELVKRNKNAEDYAKVLDAQSRGYTEGEKELRKYNLALKEQELLKGRTKEEMGDAFEQGMAQQEDLDRQDRINTGKERLLDLINQTDNANEKYYKQLEVYESLRPYAETEEQVRALNLAIQQLHIENNSFLSALDQGFTDLNKNAGDMWERFLEEGKFSMDSIQGSFKKMLAQMAHEALTKPILISLQNAVMGTNLAGGWGEVYGGLTGGSGGGGIGNLLGLANGAKNLWGAFSGGVNSTLASGINSVGSMLGNSTLTSFASGLGSAGMASAMAGAAGTTASVTGVAGLSGLKIGSGVAASMGTSAATGLTSGAMGAGQMAAAAMPWIAGAGAVYTAITTLHKMFKGETRSGGGFIYHRDVDRTDFGGGPSGGYGGQETMSNMHDILSAQTKMIDDSIKGIGLADISIANFAASFESSTKGRGGTSSGGTLIIDGQAIHFGSVDDRGGVVKGKGYGGKTGTTEEMFDNMLKDMAYSGLEAFEAMGARLPKVLSKVFDGKEIRKMSTDQASEALTYIQNVISEVNQAIEALDKLPFENLTNLTFDLSASLMEASGGVSNFMGGLDSFYTNFYTEMERGEHSTKLLEDAIAKLGLSLPDTRQGFRDLVDGLDGLDEANHETIAGLLNLSSAASDHYNRIGDSLDKLNEQIENSVLGTFEHLSSEVNRLFSLRNTGRNLVDKISGQLGRDPLNAAKRESELWSQINKGTAEQQISMAEELLGLINARHDLELKRNDSLIETIEKQLDGMRKMLELSISLNEYIKSLETSDLSPNTLRQKVGIAENTLIEQINKAKEGDEDAMGEVQGSLEKALRLWREYGASGQDYQEAYYRLTGLAKDLALGNINSLDPETKRLEQQIELLQSTRELSESQLAELENLYNLTDKATNETENMYNHILWSLEQEALHLENIGLNTDHLMEMRDLLASMPADIAANLNPVMQGLINKQVEGWYEDAFGTRADEGGLNYWTDRVQNEGYTQPKKEFDKIVNEDNHMRKIISGWYTTHAGKNPDREGLEYWVDHVLDYGYDHSFNQFMKIVNGSHKDGLSYVPYDGYVAELHKGERVLTSHENERYSRVGTDNGAVLRELQQLRQEVANNTRATLDVGSHQIAASQQAAEETSRIIVTGVGSAIRERSRDDTIRSNSTRRGIL